MNAIFELVDQQATQDVLALWTVLAPAGEVAFGTVAGGSQPLQLRVNLPQRPLLAAQVLARGQEQIQAHQQGLADATARLQALLPHLVAPAGGEVAFTLENTPERALIALLERVSQHPSEVAFESDAATDGHWQAAFAQLQNLLQEARQFVAAYAWVETRIDGDLKGRTVVGWAGDVQTIYQQYVAAQEQMLHQQSLYLALESRAALLATVATVTYLGAQLARITALASTPGGAALALPAAWQFIQSVLAL